MKSVSEWLKENRILPLTLLMKKLKLKMTGYYIYYGIRDNSENLDRFRYLVRRLTFKWLNIRSQRRSYNWTSYDRMFNYFNIPKAKVYVNIFELKQEITHIL